MFYISRTDAFVFHTLETEHLYIFNKKTSIHRKEKNNQNGLNYLMGIYKFMIIDEQPGSSMLEVPSLNLG